MTANAPNSSENFVFLHGINNSPLSWRGVTEQLPQAQTHAPLLPATADVDELAAELLRELPESFVLVGHSFGGYISLAMLARAPDRIAGLVLVNSLDNADTPEAALARERKASRALEGEYEELASAATRASYHPSSLTNATLMDERHRTLSEYGPARFAAHQRASATRPDRSSLLETTSTPTLVIAAADDAVITAARQLEMAKRVGATWTTIAGAGHMLPAERPLELAHAIRDWAATL